MESLNPILKPTKIEFTDSNLQEIKEEQERRIQNNKHTRQLRIDQKRTDDELDQEGVLGEAAFCVMAGIPFDQMNINRCKDADFDYMNFTVEIKSTSHKDGHLIIPNHQELKARVAFLIWIENEKTAHVVGWISNKQFHKSRFKRIFSFKYGEEWCVSQKELRPNVEFFRHIYRTYRDLKL